MVIYYCQGCGSEIQDNDENIGGESRCPHCGGVNIIPDLDDGSGQNESLQADSSSQIAEVSLYNENRETSGEYDYAGFWKRFAAVFIDGVILAFAGGVIGGIFGAVTGGVLGAAGADINVIQGMCGIIGGVLGLILRWLYYTLLECSSKQATLGKMALGIIVTDGQGNRISFARANGRYWAKIISGLILYIGFIMAGFTERKQALHDMMAGSLVVNKQ